MATTDTAPVRGVARVLILLGVLAARGAALDAGAPSADARTPYRERPASAVSRATVVPTPLPTASTTPPAAAAAPTPGSDASGPASSTAAETEPTGTLHVLMLNGGGRREVNYLSHLQHLRAMLARLREIDSLAPEQIVVFSGDGDDPAADVATREPRTPPGFWLLPRARAAHWLRPPITYVDSRVEGTTLRPARKDALRAWFDADGARLRGGDRLLLYVTDHGEKNARDTTNNTITLWGESLSVTELREMLGRLDPAVRVIMLMSQCFSGAFANLITPPARDDGPGDSGPVAATGRSVPASIGSVIGPAPGRPGAEIGPAAAAGEYGADGAARPAPPLVEGELPSGNVCGYFSTVPDRPAYGCYPENRGKDGIGHSYEFIDALGKVSRFPEAEQRVLVTDRTPDVPHATTDVFLERLLRAAATRAGRDFTAVVDELLAEAWSERAVWEPEIRLLDRIGHTYGTFSPRSLTELERLAGDLPEFSSRLRTYADRWRETFDSLAAENLRDFVAEHPSWRARLDSKALGALDAAGRQATTQALLAELVPFSGADPERHRRLRWLKHQADEAERASYRAEVRLGVVLRLRMLLTSIAGRVHVYHHATAEERLAFERLLACENLVLPLHAPAVSAASLEAPEPFPPLADERDLVEALMPAYMGIHFRPLQESQREEHHTLRGAVAVLTVSDDSPAAAAGLRVGDIILGPPGRPFREPEQVREWTMRSEIGVPAPLDVLRDGAPLRITLRPGPYPLALPELPGPPKVGSLAPPLKVETYPTRQELAAGRPRLLFFWATWCTICKEALPELLAFAKARHVEVVAITDEDPKTLGRFFESWADPFPSVVAMDPLRVTSQVYGVSGTPTFVLLDAQGIVRGYQTGYRRDRGLQFDGWKWARR